MALLSGGARRGLALLEEVRYVDLSDRPNSQRPIRSPAGSRLSCPLSGPAVTTAIHPPPTPHSPVLPHTTLRPPLPPATCTPEPQESQRSQEPRHPNPVHPGNIANQQSAATQAVHVLRGCSVVPSGTSPPPGWLSSCTAARAAANLPAAIGPAVSSRRGGTGPQTAGGDSAYPTAGLRGAGMSFGAAVPAPARRVALLRQLGRADRGAGRCSKAEPRARYVLTIPGPRLPRTVLADSA